MKNIMLLFLITFLISGCDQGPSQDAYNALVTENDKLKIELEELKKQIPNFDNYVGLWHLKNSSSDVHNNKVLQIQKDGHTYTVIENLFSRRSESRQKIPLSISDNQFVIKGGRGEIVFALVNKGNELIVQNKPYARITTVKFEEIEKAINLADQQKKENSRLREKRNEENSRLCEKRNEELKKLRSEYDTQYRKTPRGEREKLIQEWEKTKNTFREHEKEIENCVLLIY